MKTQKLEDVKINAAFYFPNPGTQYKKLPEPFPGSKEYAGAWELNGLRVIASVGRYDGVQWLHVSFSRKSRLPSYSEMQMIKRDFIGDDKKCSLSAATENWRKMLSERLERTRMETLCSMRLLMTK